MAEGRDGDREPTATLPGRGTPADALLERVVRHIQATGAANTSLRQLAAAAGTSHRMLQYYFGTRENLLGAVMVRLRQDDADRLFQGASSRREFLARAWELYWDPGHQLQTRLFFALAGAAAESPQTYPVFLNSVVSRWTEGLEELGRREGLPAARARNEARFVVAAIRGLLLDQMLTGEQDAVRRAYRAMVSLVVEPAAE